MHPFLKTMLYLGIVALAGTIIGTICYDYSIGINWIIDTLSIIGLLTGLFLSATVLFLTGCAFLYFLIRRKLKQVGFCFFPCLLPVLVAGLIMPAMGIISPRSHKILCSVNVREIGRALYQYTNEHNGKLPDKWCDTLILDQNLTTSFLSCRSDASFTEGESSYALNKNVFGMTISKLSPETVILFETDYVGENPEIKMPMGERKFVNKKNSYLVEEKEVREGAWNQIGGIDIVACSHHAGLGCHILFADGHVEFVKKNNISKLRWKP